jgi:hypothetical protein
VPRSLAATELGKQLIQKALDAEGWTAEDLSLYFDDNSEVSVGRSTAYNFGNGLNVRPEKFQAMCGVLNLDWEIVSGRKGQVVSEPESPPADNSGGAEPVKKTRSTTAENLQQNSNEAHDVQGSETEHRDFPLELYPETLERILNHQWQESVRTFIRTLWVTQGQRDELLRSIKRIIDYAIFDKDLQSLLIWSNDRSIIEDGRKLVAVRAFHLLMSLDPTVVKTCVERLETAMYYAETITGKYGNFYQLRHESKFLDPVLTDAISRISLGEDSWRRKKVEQQIEDDCFRALSIRVDTEKLVRCLELTCRCALTCSVGLPLILDCNFSDALTSLYKILKNSLMKGYTDMFYLKNWWELHGEEWTSSLRQIFILYQNFNQDFRFENSKCQEIEQYINANKFLVELLKIENSASPEARQEIEDNLLLPIAELKRRLPDQYGGIEES